MQVASPTRARRGAAAFVTLALCASLLLVVQSSSEPAHALSSLYLNMDDPGPGQVQYDTEYAHLERDAAISVPLPYNKSMWIYADTIGDTFSLKGSAAISDDSNPVRTTSSVRPNGQVYELLPGAFVACPEGQTTAAWPTSAVSVPQSTNTTLIVIYFMVNCAVVGTTYSLPQKMGVATFWYDATNPGKPIQATVVNNSLFGLMWRGSGSVPGYGAAAVFDPFDNNIYVYGCNYAANGAYSCTVGRVWPGNAGNPAAYTFWNGATFVPGQASAATIALGGDLSVGPSVQWMPKLGRYVSLNNPFASNRFEVRTAPNPWGPWSDPSSVYAPDCANAICRTIALHPQLSDSSHLTISYVPFGVERPVLASVPLHVDPIGNLETVSANGGLVTATGWALDPDTGASIAVAVYVDGTSRGNANASGYRNDIASLYPWYGGNHGFSTSLNLPAGPHSVCVYAINQLIGGDNPLLGCKNVTVTIPPPSAPQSITATPGDTQALVTWALPANTGGVDPSTLTYAVTLSPPVPGSPFTVTGATSVLVNGLTNATPYTVTITTTNVSGTSAPSAPVLVTPQPQAGVTFHPLPPTRVLDTRNGTGLWGPIGTSPYGYTYNNGTLVLAGTNGIPANATAVVLNITATDSNANSFVTAYPAGQAVPNASNLNFANGQTVANLATVKLGAGGAVTFATAVGMTSVVADVVGWYDDGSGAGDLYNPMTPTRVLDTRTGTGWSGRLVSGAPHALAVTGVGGVPASATAVVVNITATGSSANSFVTAYPTGGGVPNASNVNFGVNQTIANLATVSIGTGGTISFATANGSTDLVADVVGWYEPGTGNRFHPLLAPTRILDDRFAIGGYSSPLLFSVPRAVTAGGANGIPPTAVATVANTTAVNSSTNSFLTVYPAGQALPNASNLNFGAGQIVPNLVVAKLGTAGKVTLATAKGQVSVVMDASGYFAPT